jgi:16S rRNA G1207 methylase RsmC
VSGDHYFSAEPTATAERRFVEFTLRGRHFRLTASAGVFSAGRLDPGTSVLLHKAPLPEADTEGPLLDLGCGYGAIAAVLATTVSGAQVYAVDVNRRALELVRDNAVTLGVGDRVVTVTPDEVPAGVTFRQIWSNPPIRIGKAALHEMLDRWLPRLAPDGVAWLVVARHLGADSLHRWLTERGWSVDRHASQKGFRVLRVTRSGNPGDEPPPVPQNG